MELSRQKYEESLLVTNADAASELSESSSSSDDRESKTEEIPQIVVDPVEEGREVSSQKLFTPIQCGLQSEVPAGKL